MFPHQSRRPMRKGFQPLDKAPRQAQRNPFLFGAPRQPEQQPSNIQTVMNMFRDAEGNMDLGKMLHTAEQINDVYKQVSPMVMKFWKK